MRLKKSVVSYIGYALAIIVVVLFLVFAVIPGFLPNSVCVSREVSDNQVTLHIDTSSLRKSNSFMIEEQYPSGISLVQSSVEPLFTENVTSKTAWMFWSGAEKIKSQDLVYTLSQSSQPTGFLISAKSPYNSEKGYARVPITNEKSCI